MLLRSLQLWGLAMELLGQMSSKRLSKNTTVSCRKKRWKTLQDWKLNTAASENGDFFFNMNFCPEKNWADNRKFPSKFEDVSPIKNGEYPASQVGFLSCGMVKVPGSQPESWGKTSQDSRLHTTTTPGPWKLTAGSPKNHRKNWKGTSFWTKPPWLWVQNVNFPGFSGAKFPKHVWCFNTFYTHRIHVIMV